MRDMLTWAAGFLAFPIAGLAGAAVSGPVDDPFAALTGGLVTGLVVGIGQSVAARGRLDPLRWIPATTAGMGAGLLLGATSVGFGTSLSELALMGALTGIPLGLAQALALTRPRWAWAAAMPVLWALGWTVTSLVGVDVGTQYTIFGATGAITVTVLSGLLLRSLRAAGPVAALPSRHARG